MSAALARRSYRVLVNLYPASFRREYGEDMVALFEDLVADRGTAAATIRTGVDLLVTVPRYHLEAVMTTSHAAAAHTATLAALPILGVSALMMDLPWWVGATLILAGAALLLANGGRLARSIRTPDSSRRTQRLRMAAVGAAIFTACVLGFLVVTSGETASTLGLLGTALPGVAALVASVGYLLAGLATPRTRTTT